MKTDTPEQTETEPETLDPQVKVAPTESDPAEETADPNMGMSDAEYDTVLMRALKNLNPANLSTQLSSDDFVLNVRRLPLTEQMLVMYDARQDSLVKAVTHFKSFKALEEALSDPEHAAVRAQLSATLQQVALLDAVTTSIETRRTGQTVKLKVRTLVEKGALSLTEVGILSSAYDLWCNTFKVRIAEAKN